MFVRLHPHPSLQPFRCRRHAATADRYCRRVIVCIETCLDRHLAWIIRRSRSVLIRFHLRIDTTANTARVLSGRVYTLHLSTRLAGANLFTQARCMPKIKHINLPRRRRSLWSSSRDNICREETEKSTSRKMIVDVNGEQKQRGR